GFSIRCAMALIRPDWPAPPRVHAFVTERGFGDMARGGPGRAAIREHVPSEPAWLRQVHGISVAKADVVRAQHEEPQADAAVALEAGTVCAITVADCMPVLLSDTAGTRVGIAHAGWRGLS